MKMIYKNNNTFRSSCKLFFLIICILDQLSNQPLQLRYIRPVLCRVDKVHRIGLGSDLVQVVIDLPKVLQNLMELRGRLLLNRFVINQPSQILLYTVPASFGLPLDILPLLLSQPKSNRFCPCLHNLFHAQGFGFSQQGCPLIKRAMLAPSIPRRYHPPDPSEPSFPYRITARPFRRAGCTEKQRFHRPSYRNVPVFRTSFYSVQPAPH